MNPRNIVVKKRPVVPALFSPDEATVRRFYLDLSPSVKRPLQVVCGGLERCSPGYAIRRETFPFYSLEYVVRGRGKLTLKGRSQAVKPGCLFSYGPGVPRYITADSANPLVKYFVEFTGTRATALMKACKMSPGSVLDVFPQHALQSLFDEIIENGLRMVPGNAELCVKLLECLALKIAGASEAVKGAESLAFAAYVQCRCHIEKHYLRLRTLQQIASECQISNAYLCRLYRRYDHQSPYQHLLRLKINFAAGRLQESVALVKEVAKEAGFDDALHSSRVFHSLSGLSPVAFRRLRSV